jgi:hypothetical protein
MARKQGTNKAVAPVATKRSARISKKKPAPAKKAAPKAVPRAKVAFEAPEEEPIDPICTIGEVVLSTFDKGEAKLQALCVQNGVAVGGSKALMAKKLVDHLKEAWAAQPMDEMGVQELALSSKSEKSEAILRTMCYVHGLPCGETLSRQDLANGLLQLKFGGTDIGATLMQAAEAAVAAASKRTALATPVNDDDMEEDDGFGSDHPSDVEGDLDYGNDRVEMRRMAGLQRQQLREQRTPEKELKRRKALVHVLDHYGVTTARTLQGALEHCLDAAGAGHLRSEGAKLMGSGRVPQEERISPAKEGFVWQLLLGRGDPPEVLAGGSRTKGPVSSWWTTMCRAQPGLRYVEPLPPARWFALSSLLVGDNGDEGVLFSELQYKTGTAQGAGGVARLPVNALVADPATGGFTLAPMQGGAQRQGWLQEKGGVRSAAQMTSVLLQAIDIFIMVLEASMEVAHGALVEGGRITPLGRGSDVPAISATLRSLAQFRQAALALCNLTQQGRVSDVVAAEAVTGALRVAHAAGAQWYENLVNYAWAARGNPDAAWLFAEGADYAPAGTELMRITAKVDATPLVARFAAHAAAQGRALSSGNEKGRGGGGGGSGGRGKDGGAGEPKGDKGGGGDGLVHLPSPLFRWITNNKVCGFYAKGRCTERDCKRRHLTAEEAQAEMDRGAAAAGGASRHVQPAARAAGATRGTRRGIKNKKRDRNAVDDAASDDGSDGGS